MWVHWPSCRYEAEDSQALFEPPSPLAKRMNSRPSSSNPKRKWPPSPLPNWSFDRMIASSERSSGCTHSAIVPWVTSKSGTCSMNAKLFSPLNSSAASALPSRSARVGGVGAGTARPSSWVNANTEGPPRASENSLPTPPVNDQYARASGSSPVSSGSGSPISVSPPIVPSLVSAGASSKPRGSKWARLFWNSMSPFSGMSDIASLLSSGVLHLWGRSPLRRGIGCLLRGPSKPMIIQPHEQCNQIKM